MSAQLILLLSIFTNLIFIVFLAFYFLNIRRKEKKLNEKEQKIDYDYHRIVDDALNRERKIIEDAGNEAAQIISKVNFVNEETKKIVNDAMMSIVSGIQKQAVDTSGVFMQSYKESLQKISEESTSDFAKTAKAFKEDLEKQTKEFRESILPNLEKEMMEYRKLRLKQTEEIIARVVQKVSREVLNKSLTTTDHQEILIQSLEKAKREGFFE